MKEKIVTEQNIARFEKELKKSEKTPNTIHKYVRDVRKLQTYADGRGLTRDLMIAYKKELEEQGGYKANSDQSVLHRYEMERSVHQDDQSTANRI